MLVGGASRRMGRDKATLPLDGGAPGDLLGARAIAALRAAGVAPVLVVGAREEHAVLWDTDAPDVMAVPDEAPGEGPLGGIVTALRAGAARGASAVVVLACDLPLVTAADVRALLGAASEHRSAGASEPDAVTLGSVDGRVAPPNGVWPIAALEHLAAAFAAGERSPVRALSGRLMATVDLDGLADADDPSEIPRRSSDGTG